MLTVKALSKVFVSFPDLLCLLQATKRTEKAINFEFYTTVELKM